LHWRALRLPGHSHPEIGVGMPQERENWSSRALAELAGAMSRPADPGRGEGENIYFQRIVGAILFQSCFSPTAPRRKCSARAGNGRLRPPMSRSVSAAACAPPASRRAWKIVLTEIAEMIARACRLRGLNSIDLLVDGDEVS